MPGDLTQSRRKVGAALALLVALTGCGSRNGDDPPASTTPPPAVPNPPPAPPPPPAPANRAPTAIAGGDITVGPGQSVTLSAAASTDPDGDALSYQWVIAGGAGGALTQANLVNAAFSSAVAGTYVIELTVRDPGNLAASDAIVVDVRLPLSTTAITLEKLDGILLAGSSETIVVHLPRPAGAGGMLVNLQSSQTAVARAPATIEVAEGESVAAFNLEGVAPGTATISATASGVEAGSIATTVQQRAWNISASTGRHGIAVGQQSTLTIRLEAPAPVGGARVGLALTNAARATLSASQVDIAAGATEGSVTLTGAAPGSVAVSGDVPGGGGGEPLRVMVIPAGAANDRGSNDLIDAALANGSITAEQATVYGIQAAYGAPELPAQFRGNDVGRIDGPSGRLANLRIAGMSAASQEAIGKYLFPPIYADGWGAAITPTQQKTALVRPRAAAVSCFESLRGMPRQDTLPHWRSIRSGVFKVWYPSVLGPDVSQFGWYTAEENRAAALRVAATISADFETLSAVLGNVLRDDGIACNGGDNAIDVYVTRIGLGETAQVMPYLPGECARPGWMWVAPDMISNVRESSNIIGHELVHLFQLRYARPNCDDWRYNILDEATASWSFDFLRPGDNYEHAYLTDLPSYFEPTAGEWRASPLETGAGGIRNCNGYCDYPFFQWLSRKYSPNAIRSVLDATASANAQQSFENGLGGYGGGLERLWPAFALFQWNDHVEHVQDELHRWSDLSDASIRRGVIPGINGTLDVKLDGQPKRSMGDDVFDKAWSLRGAELPAMTTHYLHLKFDDPDVARVHFEHRASRIRGQWPRFKAQAIQKIDGEWQEPEDWSGELEKRYCRDKREERIEELVLVFSHSHAGTEPFLRSGPTVVQIYDNDSKPKLDISNAACMPWHGVQRVTQTNQFGGVTNYRADVTYKLFVPPGEDPEVIRSLPQQSFVPESGTASVDSNWIDAIGCRQTINPVSGAIDEADSRLNINFDTRTAGGGGVTTIQDGTYTLTCPGVPPMSYTAPVPSLWLSLGISGGTLSANGRSISGERRETSAETGVTTVYEWDLSAEREE